jgi:hypothetical protein
VLFLAAVSHVFSSSVRYLVLFCFLSASFSRCSCLSFFSPRLSPRLSPCRLLCLGFSGLWPRLPCLSLPAGSCSLASLCCVWVLSVSWAFWSSVVWVCSLLSRQSVASVGRFSLVRLGGFGLPCCFWRFFSCFVVPGLFAPLLVGLGPHLFLFGLRLGRSLAGLWLLRFAPLSWPVGLLIFGLVFLASAQFGSFPLVSGGFRFLFSVDWWGASASLFLLH